VRLSDSAYFMVPWFPEEGTRVTLQVPTYMNTN